MVNYKELFYSSQAEIANVIDTLELILDNLRKNMIQCEEEVISEHQNNIKIHITNQEDEENKNA